MGFIKEKTRDYFLLDTSVENIFINEYMAGAPGDFVKVYLFALMYAGLGVELTNEDIAKNLSMEHEDVLKAWNHWEKMGAVRKVRRNPEDKFDYDVEFRVLREQLYGEKEPKRPGVSDQNVQSFMADNDIQDMFPFLLVRRIQHPYRPSLQQLLYVFQSRAYVRSFRHSNMDFRLFPCCLHCS